MCLYRPSLIDVEEVGSCIVRSEEDGEGKRKRGKKEKQGRGEVKKGSWALIVEKLIQGEAQGIC